MSDERARSTALLLIDVINGFDFPGCEGLVRAAESAAPRIVALRERCRQAEIPIIYVNDNFGQWRSDFRSTVAACLKPDQPGHRVSKALTPGEQDYFVLKPRHSAFYCTALEVLLQQLDSKRLIVVGFATNICVLYTAADAHMRGFEVVVPSDCTASNTPELTAQALQQMKLVSEASVEPSTELDLSS
jgi:nicotinamidase-related amidase